MFVCFWHSPVRSGCRRKAGGRREWVTTVIVRFGRGAVIGPTLLAVAIAKAQGKSDTAYQIRQEFLNLEKQAIPDISLRPVIHQRLDDLPFALGAVFGRLDLAPGGCVFAEIALYVVDEGLDLAQRPRQCW